jgi:sulfonate transport system substrate-binding protein
MARVFVRIADLGSFKRRQHRVIATGAGFNGHREYYFARKDFLAAHPEIVAPLLAGLDEVGIRAKQNPKATADFLAGKLGISAAVMERSEFRKQRYNPRPLDGGIIQEQQEAADTFLQLGLITHEIKVSEDVYTRP